MIAALVLLVGAALARPTDGGQFGFEPEDVVDAWETPSGLVRVHYAVEGPSTTILDDLDLDGVPDFPQRVGRVVEDVELVFVAAGFRAPLTEAAVGLGPLGGSAAFDVYLVEFGGGADGAFRVDGCRDGACAGHLLIENDFKGYGYPSLEAAVDTLAAHELFHAVQAAYLRDLPVWVSEGTAVYAQRLVDPDNGDFLRYAQAYLDDAGRSLDKPPIGPVPAFAYATGLWFDFLALRYGDAAILSLLERLAAGAEPLDAIGAVLAEQGEGWAPVWMDFAAYNLATGRLAGEVGSYPYADRIRRGVAPALEGTSLDETRRFFPLATTYYKVRHDGGALRVATEACDERLSILVSPAVGGEDGPVGPAVGGGVGPELRLGSAEAPLAAGTYWVAVSLPEPAPESVRTRICVGSERWCDVVPACDPGTPPEPEPEPRGGCATSAGPVGAVGLLAAALFLLGRRGLRRRSFARRIGSPGG